MKTIILTLIALITLTNAFSPLASITPCHLSLFKVFSSLKNKINSIGLEELSKQLPQILTTCGNTQLNFDSLSNQACIQDLSNGFSIIQRMLQQTDNKARLALDMALLERVYKNKVQKDCTFLSEVDFDLKTGGVCLQSAYELSLTVQTMFQDLAKGNTTAALKDLQTFLDDLPDTLDACGQSAWANKIRKDFPVDCMRSFDALGKQLIVFQHNYDHIEWLVVHWKDLAKVLGEVKKACPVFA